MSRAAAPRAAILAAGVLAALTGAPAAQKPPRNAPELCTHCGGDPEVLARAGALSHGGFAFGRSDTAAIDALLTSADIRWIETEHFEIGFGLGNAKVEKREEVRAELTELAEVLAEVRPRTRVVEPWLRTHLYAVRLERMYQRFLEIAGLEGVVFPDGNTIWDMTGPYMGEGPYVGQKGKFEVLVLPSESLSVQFMKAHYGLDVSVSQRWNMIDLGTLSVVVHTQQDGVRDDAGLHAHLAFNVAHMMIDGYKHYAYDLPVWIKEGLAHFMEREIDPRYNTFDGSEGAAPMHSRKADWDSEVRQLLTKGDAPRMSQLLDRRSFGELTVRDHYTTWSMTAFLIGTHPEAYACILDRLKGIMDERGLPDGSDMPGRQRDAFRDCLGMSFADFDRAWSSWVLGVAPGEE